MKISPPNHRRAFVALVPTLMLLAAPAIAQEVQTAPAPAVIPPPVVPTINATPPAPTPPVATPTAPAPVAAAPEEAEAAPVARQTTRSVRQTRTTTAAPAPRRAVRVAAPAPVARAPIAEPAPAPVAVAPITAPEAAPVAEVPAAVAPAPEAAAPVADTDASTTTTQAAPVWPWVLAGIVAILAILGALMWRRRRAADEVYYKEDYVEPVAAAEPAYVEPAYVEPVRAAPVIAPEPQFLRVAPLAAAPIAAAAADVADSVAVEAELVEPEAEDVAALTAGAAPANRPWLEFAMRPVRAGSNADDALVEIELTVGNSGSVAAHDVRISTFMFASEAASESEVDRLLLERKGAGEVAPITIEPGEGTRVDATLSLPKEMLGGEEARTFVPVIVADARYRLADGTEGHTSASFTIGMSGEDEEMRPIAIHRPQMSDNIEARLHGVPEHA
ncbi:hypothetical protein ACVWZA_002130 [Sphingomonas sp. UYAg733]